MSFNYNSMQSMMYYQIADNSNNVPDDTWKRYPSNSNSNSNKQYSYGKTSNISYSNCGGVIGCVGNARYALPQLPVFTPTK